MATATAIVVPVQETVGLPWVAEEKTGCDDGSSQRPARLAGVKWVQIFARLAIAWFHEGGPGADLAYGGLPAFVAVGRWRRSHASSHLAEHRVALAA